MKCRKCGKFLWPWQDKHPFLKRHLRCWWNQVLEISDQRIDAGEDLYENTMWLMDKKRELLAYKHGIAL